MSRDFPDYNTWLQYRKPRITRVRVICSGRTYNAGRNAAKRKKRRK